MSKFSDLEQECARYAAEKTRLVDAIKAEISGLPDNPRIRRAAGNPKCFVTTFADLGGNWSVEHHDFKLQYDHIATMVGKSENPSACLVRAIAEGRIKIGSPGYWVTLHEDVKAHLMRLAGVKEILWTSNAEWPAGTCPSDRSDDTHATRRAAEAVCSILIKEGFGGNRRVFPLRTWVEPKGSK